MPPVRKEERQKEDIADRLGQIGLRLLLVELLQLLFALGPLLRIGTLTPGAGVAPFTKTGPPPGWFLPAWGPRK